MTNPNELVHHALQAVARALEAHVRINTIFASRNIFAEEPQAKHCIERSGIRAWWGSESKCKRSPLELEWRFNAVVSKRSHPSGANLFEPSACATLVSWGRHRTVISEAYYWGDKEAWYARPPSEVAATPWHELVRDRPTNATAPQAFAIIEQIADIFLLGSEQRLG